MFTALPSLAHAAVEVTVDNGDAGFVSLGKATLVNDAGYQNDYLIKKSGWVRWKSQVEAGEYEVLVTWEALPKNSKKVRYRVKDGRKTLDKVNINQRKEPNGPEIDGVKWQVLGTYDFTKGKPKVIAKGKGKRGKRQMVADAVRFKSTTDNAPEVIELRVDIDGPATQDYTPDDNDAVLGNLEMAVDAPVLINFMYLAIEGQTATGEPFGDKSIVEVLEDVEIRNTVTGQTIDAVTLVNAGAAGETASSTYQVYRLDNFIHSVSHEAWEIRVDFTDNGNGHHPEKGDQFRVHLCAEGTVNPDGSANTGLCNFGGLIPGTTAYQLDASGLSGELVDVKPGGNVTGNFHRVLRAMLTVAVKSLNDADTAVENQDNINMLRFEARAGEVEDILLTRAIFEAAQGSPHNVQNYTIWVDTNKDGVVDTILEDGVSVGAGVIDFSDFAGGGYVIPAEETVVFEVHGDVASSLVDDQIQLAFATNHNLYLEAEELDDGSGLYGIETDGTCSVTSCQITVSTVPSTLWTLVEQGDLYVTQDTTPLRNRQLLGGTLGEAVLRIQLHAENEDIDVTDLQITSVGGLANSVDRLELYLDGEADPFALATVGGCGTDAAPTTDPDGSPAQSFCANMESRQLVVPSGEDVDVLVRPRMKTDNAGGFTNDPVQFYISGNPAADEATGEGAVRARGDASSNNLLANDEDTMAEGEIFIGTDAPSANADIVGNENVSVLAKIVSISNANPDPNGTGVPVGVTPFGQFKFTAATHNNSNNGDNDVILDSVIFNVNATNVEMNGGEFKLYNKANSTVTHDCIAQNAAEQTMTGTVTGSLYVRCSDIDVSVVNTEVDEGTDSTFVLQGEVTNPKTSVTTSTLQASLTNFDNYNLADTFGVNQSHINWIDSDGSGQQAFQWIEYPDTTVNSTTYQS